MTLYATQRDERRPKIVLCHSGHENDIAYMENISEFLSSARIDHDRRNLGTPFTRAELQASQEHFQTSLLGFNSQIDHGWVGNQPLVQEAARHGIPVMQWIMDHPGGRWPEFNYSNAKTSRFLFHSSHSRNYFEKFCCSGAISATVGSVGPNWRSRSAVQGSDAFSRRPIVCLIPLGLARLNISVSETQRGIEKLDPTLARILRQAVSRARFELDHPLESGLAAELADNGVVIDDATFNQCFRLLNDSVQHFRRSFIIRTASRFGVHIQSDAAALLLVEAGPASFRQNVGTFETLHTMPLCRSVLSVSPVNDSIHDRTCNALNAGCLPVLEDNSVHRELFTHGENALLFRYDDDSLIECLNIVSGDPLQIHAMAERARRLRDHERFRYGLFRNMVAVAAETD